jgi:DmsE family decaheme c-type cytochrome
MTSRNPLLWCLGLLLLATAAAAQEPTEPVRQKRTPRYSEEGAASCLLCHSGPEMRAVQNGPHFNLQNPGAPAAHHYCESCHGPGSIHVSRAHGGKGFPPLTEFGKGADKAPREEQLAACMQCHGMEGAVRKHIGFIGSPHDRKNINCSTCHTVHAESDPIYDREEQAETCYRCHRKMKTGHPRFESRSMDIDVLPCSSCHDVHRPLPVME